jgi:hypothetical protein
MGARNDEIRDKILRSRWLAVLLFSLAWTQPVNAQENIPGRWHFSEDREIKSCILVAEGFNGGLAIVAGPDKVIISVTLLHGRRLFDRDDGSGTLVAATPNSLRLSEEVTIPFARGEPDARGNPVAASYNAAVTRNEVQKGGRRSHQINQRLQNHVPGCSKMTRASGQLSRTIANIAPSSSASFSGHYLVSYE